MKLGKSLFATFWSWPKNIRLKKSDLKEVTAGSRKLIFGGVSRVCNMGVSKNRGTPKSSILTGFSIINHPFWGTPILETPICCILCSIGIFCLHRNTLRTYIWVQLELEHMMCHLAVDVMLPPVFSMRSGFDLVMIYGHRGMWWSRWEVLVVAFKQKATWHDPSPLSLC